VSTRLFAIHGHSSDGQSAAHVEHDGIQTRTEGDDGRSNVSVERDGVPVEVGYFDPLVNQVIIV
jgi:hypothetical protein